MVCKAMEDLILSILLTLIGSYFLFRNAVQFRDENKLRAYLETSPKARLWVNRLGMEKTVSLSKFLFIPLGIVISIVLIGTGLCGIASHFSLF